jgi:hypothetical protein
MAATLKSEAASEQLGAISIAKNSKTMHRLCCGVAEGGKFRKLRRIVILFFPAESGQRWTAIPRQAIVFKAWLEMRANRP